MDGIRLNRFLASCGVASRRSSERLIEERRVSVNGEVATTPALRITQEDQVRLDGKLLQVKEQQVVLFYKPRGLVCSSSDELGRQTIYTVLPPKLHHLKHVGRLDKDSEGLLILSNDGELAQRLTHPEHKMEKEYIVTLGSSFDNDILDALVSGVRTPEGKLYAKSVMRLSSRRVSMVLETGIKRQIRLMFQSLGLRVMKLVRVRIASLFDQSLKAGKWRYLRSEELPFLEKNPPKKRFLRKK